MTAELVGTAVAVTPGRGHVDLRPTPHFAADDAEVDRGRQLAAMPAAAAAFRSWFRTTGTPDLVESRPLVTLPYPTRFGLWRASSAMASPSLAITNRLVVIRWHEQDGRPRILLFDPSDVDLDANTPYFAALAKRTERLPAAVRSHFIVRHGDVTDHLRRLGIQPAEVDYITFDHLHTQDVRRWLGTTEPQADISPRRPLEPVFPNACLLVQAAEWDSLGTLHPLQRPWYLPHTYTALRPDAIATFEGDVLVGPGVAFLATPGHTRGNHSLVLNTSTGVWASSENVIAAELLTPEHSRIPGVRRRAEEWGQELILNANTLEDTARQYNSCVKEKAVVDRSRADPRFLQFQPSSELTRHSMYPRTAPTFSHGGIAHRTVA